MALKSWQISFDQISIGSNPSLLDGIGMDSKINPEQILKNMLNFSMVGEKRSKGSSLGKMGPNCKTKSNGRLGHEEHFFLCKSFGCKIRLETHINSEFVDRSHHPQIISPTPILDWIRDMRSIKPPNGSIIWKYLCKSFSLISEGRG